MSVTIAITGANGFVGTVLARTLADRGHQVRCLVRRQDAVSAAPSLEYRVVPELCDSSTLTNALDGVDVVFHLAARAHVMKETSGNPDEAFRRANVEVTRTVLRACDAAGVGRLVYASSIKVNGERTDVHPFRAADEPCPSDAYARSKLAAEQLLADEAGAIETCIVRPPLIYGNGVKGNLLRLLQLVRRGLPLPLRSLRNQRSLVSVHNLASFFERCALDPRAAGQTFVLADARPVSTAEIARQMARGMGRPARLVPMPARLLRLVGAITGRRAVIDRLVGSMVVDASASYARLDWTPEIDTLSGLRAMAADFALQPNQQRHAD